MNARFVNARFVNARFSLSLVSTHFPLYFAGTTENVVKAVKWLKDGHAVTNMDPKYQKFDSKLRVNNVQTEDGGVYQCFVTLDGGKQMQSSGELRLGGKKYSILFL